MKILATDEPEGSRSRVKTFIVSSSSISWGPSKGCIKSNVTPWGTFLSLWKFHLDLNFMKTKFYSLKIMIGHSFHVRRRVNIFNSQIKLKIVCPHCRLKIEKTSSMNGNCHVWHHRDEIKRIWCWLSKALVIIVITEHADTLASTKGRLN